MPSLTGKIGATIQALIDSWRLFVKVLITLLQRLVGRRKCKNRRRPTGCFMIPPDVSRSPDPCLYSQTYLMAQGLSVTWNNPDIQITKPDGTPVDSSALEPDTEYRVVATIHNASFDAALGVQVICVYRPWSFGTDERIPVETDNDGNPAIRVLNIGAWGAKAATFTWRTPALQPGNDKEHYCLQVECFHPQDKEPNNNIGQENTNVIRTASSATIKIPLQNLRRARQDIRLEIDEYRIPDSKIEIPLSRVDRVAPTTDRRLHKKSIRFDDSTRNVLGSALRGAHIRLRDPDIKTGKRAYSVHGYTFGRRLRESNRRGAFPLGAAWAVSIDVPGLSIALDGKEKATLTFEVEPDGSVAPGTTKHINVNAFNQDGSLLGGVTLVVEVS